MLKQGDELSFEARMIGPTREQVQQIVRSFCSNHKRVFCAADVEDVGADSLEPVAGTSRSARRLGFDLRLRSHALWFYVPVLFRSESSRRLRRRCQVGICLRSYLCSAYETTPTFVGVEFGVFVDVQNEKDVSLMGKKVRNRFASIGASLTRLLGKI